MSTFREPDLREAVVALETELDLLRADNEKLRTELAQEPPISRRRTEGDEAREAERRRQSKDALAALEAIARRGEEVRKPAQATMQSLPPPPMFTDQRVDLAMHDEPQRAPPLAPPMVPATRTTVRFFAPVAIMSGAAWLLWRLTRTTGLDLADMLALAFIVVGLVGVFRPKDRSTQAR